MFVELFMSGMVRVTNEEVPGRAVIVREFARRVDLRVLRRFEHTERKNEQHIAIAWY